MHNLPACHDVCIHISGISRLDDERAVLRFEQIQKVAELVARAARTKHLVIRYIYAAGTVKFGDFRPQKRRAAFRHIPVERFGFALIFHAFP